MTFSKPPTHAPTAPELQADHLVRAALEQAWVDSEVSDPLRRHEEGGWIYLDLSSGKMSIQRAKRGATAGIDLSYPPVMAGCIVVGKFHTHPNPGSEGWNPGPSQADHVVDARHGVPDLIRADNGVHFSGPPSRRGGLSGGAGYPP